MRPTTEEGPLSSSGNPLRSLSLLVAVSVVAGLLAAGVVLPLVGGIGAGAKSAASAFESLPSELTMPQLSQRTQIVAADGTPLATFYYENRQVVPLKQIPMAARNAIIAIEDSRFYQDEGIDLKGIVRAAVTNAGAGGVRQGGSTLTQQLVKNVLVQTASTKAQQRAATSDTISRKIREARYAVALAKTMPKNEILNRYLNIVYFGEGAYGIATAAKHYFGVPVDKMTLAQSAMLAGLVRNPVGYDPVRHPDAAKQRRNTVLGRMRDLGYITAARAAVAMHRPLGLHVTTTGNGCENTWAPFYCDYVITQVLSDPHLGKTVDDRRRLLLSGGLTIRTALQPRVQRASQHAVDHNVPPTNRNNGGHGIAAASVSVDPATGAVEAMAVDRKYGHEKRHGVTSVNYATGGSTGYQAGSTFKMFVLAAAVQQGLPLDKTYNCPHDYASKKYTDYENGVQSPYTVHNAGDSEAGRFDITQATWRSVNTCYLQIEEDTGYQRPWQLAKEMGVNVEPADHFQVPSFFLGTVSTSPLDMAGAYATIADDGVHCVTHAITKVTAGSKVIEDVKPDCHRVLSVDDARTVSSVLQGVVDSSDPYRTGLNAQISRPAAGKTGTTNDEQEAWFVGFVPQLATAVWVGDPRGPKYPLHNISIHGHYYDVVYGGDIPAMTWHDLMTDALAGVPVQDFPEPMAASQPKAPPPPPTPTVAPSSSAPAPSPSGKPTPPPKPQPSPTTTAPKPKPTKTKPGHHGNH